MGNVLQYYRALNRGAAPPVATPFISTWNTANISTGGSTSTQVKLPLMATGTYDFMVEWGDGSSDVITVWNQAETTHTYGASGIKTITITGTIIGFEIANLNAKDRLKILDISQWGSLTFLANTSINNGAFYGCTNLNITATDAPTFQGGIAGFFRSCTSLVYNSSINNWNVSPSDSFQSCFLGASSFNQPLDNWDVSNATTIRQMLSSATLFNQPINNWNVGNVIDFSIVFSLSTNFNQDIGSWNVSASVSFTNFMFGKTAANYSAANLNSIYNGWTNRSLPAAQAINFNTIKYTTAATVSRALLTRTNATVTATNAANNGSGLIRITTGAVHGLTTGDKIFISGILGTTEANGAWLVTVINTTTIDLQASTFTNTYTSGGTVRTGYGWTITDGGI